MNLQLTDQELKVLRELLKSTIDQMDEMMQSRPTRELADVVNALSDIQDKIGSDNESV